MHPNPQPLGARSSTTVEFVREGTVETNLELLAPRRLGDRRLVGLPYRNSPQRSDPLDGVLGRDDAEFEHSVAREHAGDQSFEESLTVDIDGGLAPARR